ncbi:TPA: hypothetical protein DCQ44_02410 [Candidatus Taylorbacteria bacterium]|nr:hypothetical protein [Candidatus Taylorbacteria bacterium]
MFTILLYVLLGLVVLGIIGFVVLHLTVKKVAAEDKTAAASSATTDQPVDGTKKPETKDTRGPNERTAGLILKVWLWFLVAAIFVAVCVGLYSFVHPEKPEKKEVANTRSVGVDGNEQPNQYTAPNFYDLDRRSTKYESLIVYRDHEVMLPPETAHASIKTRNTTDIFVIRGELDGKDVGSWTFTGAQGVETPFPKTDRSWIKSTNVKQTVIDFVDLH